MGIRDKTDETQRVWHRARGQMSRVMKVGELCFWRFHTHRLSHQVSSKATRGSL